MSSYTPERQAICRSYSLPTQLSLISFGTSQPPRPAVERGSLRGREVTAAPSTRPKKRQKPNIQELVSTAAEMQDELDRVQTGAERIARVAAERTRYTAQVASLVKGDPFASGKFGRVSHTQSPSKVVKQTSPRKLPPGQRRKAYKSFLKEIRLQDYLFQVNVPGVPEIFDVGMVTSESAYVVMENAGQDMFDQAGKLNLSELRSFTRSVLQTLSGMHENGIGHFDIKPGNLGRTLTLDFGLAKEATASHPIDGSKIRQGSLHYAAPEVILGLKYDFQADMWSLGVTLFAITTAETFILDERHLMRDWCLRLGTVPLELLAKSPLHSMPEKQWLATDMQRYVGEKYAGYGIAHALRKALISKPENLKKAGVSETNSEIEAYIKLIEAMIVFDPAKRITAKDALRHPALSTTGRENKHA